MDERFRRRNHEPGDGGPNAGPLPISEAPNAGPLPISEAQNEQKGFPLPAFNPVEHLLGTKINCPTVKISLATIHWKSRLTGRQGHGSPIPVALAESEVAAANKLYPEVEHWLVRAPDSLFHTLYQDLLHPDGSIPTVLQRPKDWRPPFRLGLLKQYNLLLNFHIAKAAGEDLEPHWRALNDSGYQTPELSRHPSCTTFPFSEGAD